MAINPARGAFVEALRLSRGFTQAEMARRVNVSQSTLSKVESGTDIDDAHWEELGRALGVPSSAFRAVDPGLAPVHVFHRKQRGTPKGAVNKVGAEIALMTQRLSDLLGAHPTSLRHYELEDGFITPQDIARSVRKDLGLGVEPISNLVAILEDAGAIIMRWPLESIRVDAVAAWPDESAPVILVGEHVTAERQRFTMAHELGHAVMHINEHVDEATVDQEKEADAFAGEFLIPWVALRKEWPAQPSLDALITLKQRWGISLAALIHRGHDTGLLTEDEYRNWSIELSTTGMHRREPASLPREDPTALGSAINEAIEGGASVGELAAQAHMSELEFSSTFLPKEQYS
ncbi:XRE family transcriptional regulator [Microbacterium sp. LWO13-1.2]|uniref:helix-turn-helix domain-containing protein n=1 Tax=Microbacterium sp. LWO13-1.2 TaxID=3135262 RepID=UPI003139454C